MADKQTAAPAAPPKPVHIGGESIVDRLLPHIKKIIIGIVVVAVVLTIVFAMRWVKQRRESANTEKLAQVVDVGMVPLHGPLDQPDPTKKKTTESFATAKDRSAAVLDTMAKMGTDSAGHAYKGGALLDVGKLDEAIAEYKLGASDKGLEGVLAREGLGLALEAKATAEKDPAARQKGYEAALAAFTEEQPDVDGPRRAYALYHQARMQELIGKKAEAKASFEKAKELGKSTDLAELIEKRLAALGAS